MIFDMQIKHNSASFYDPLTKLFVAVDSFDNENFEVRVGSVQQTESQGTIIAYTDKELNEKLVEIVKKFKDTQRIKK